LLVGLATAAAADNSPVPGKTPVPCPSSSPGGLATPAPCPSASPMPSPGSPEPTPSMQP